MQQLQPQPEPQVIGLQPQPEPQVKVESSEKQVKVESSAVFSSPPYDAASSEDERAFPYVVLSGKGEAAHGEEAADDEAAYGEEAADDEAAYGEEAADDEAAYGEEAADDEAAHGEEADDEAAHGEEAADDEAAHGEGADDEPAHCKYPVPNLLRLYAGASQRQRGWKFVRSHSRSEVRTFPSGIPCH